MLTFIFLSLVLQTPRAHTADEAPACREQSAQSFLIRGNMLKDSRGFGVAVIDANKYRVEKYGSIPPKDISGLVLINSKKQTVWPQQEWTSFMNLPIQLHKKVIPVFKCVEHELRRNCIAQGDFYLPRLIGGWRDHNTYRGYEISNHMFGIAIDIDPSRNPCCFCDKESAKGPKCKRFQHGTFDVTELPLCWINTFERYGFYWLGWDEMADTMHFEFLGDPDQIL